MVDNIVTKPLGLVFFFAAHMVLNVPGQAAVTGILGSNITLQFTFWPNVSLTKSSHFAIYQYTTGKTKIAEYKQGKEGEGVFDVEPKSTSVVWHITNLKLNDSRQYGASLFDEGKPPKESNKVQLIVREENKSSTVPPMQTNIPTTEDSGGSSSHLVTVLVVSPAVLLAAVLSCFIWCLMRTRDKQQQQQQQQQPQQSSNPTVQETAMASKNVPAASLVYSVLDFPKRPPAVLEMNPSDTEYAAVSYLPEKRLV